MNTTDPVAWHSAIHPSIRAAYPALSPSKGLGERLNARQHPTNTILPQLDWLKTRQRPQNSVWRRYDWLQSRAAYQNKAVRNQNQAVRPEVSKGEHLIFFNMETVEEIEALQAAIGESA